MLSPSHAVDLNTSIKACDLEMTDDYQYVADDMSHAEPWSCSREPSSRPWVRRTLYSATAGCVLIAVMLVCLLALRATSPVVRSQPQVVGLEGAAIRGKSPSSTIPARRSMSKSSSLDSSPVSQLGGFKIGDRVQALAAAATWKPSPVSVGDEGTVNGFEHGLVAVLLDKKPFRPMKMFFNPDQLKKVESTVAIPLAVAAAKGQRDHGIGGAV